MTKLMFKKYSSYIYTLVLLFIACQESIGQGQLELEKIDSLEALLENSTTPQDEVKTLLDISYFSVLMDKEKAFNTSWRARNIALQNENDTLLSDAYWGIHYVYFFKDEMEPALLYLDSAIAIAETINIPGQEEDFKFSKAEIFNHLGQHHEAYQILVELVDQLIESGNTDAAYYGKLLLASTLDDVKEYEQARVLYEDYFAYAEEKKYADCCYKNYQFAMNCYGTHLSYNGDTEAAVRIYDEMRKVGIQKQDTYTEFVGAINLGWEYALLGKLDSANYYCENGLESSYKFDDIYAEAHNCKCLGYVALQENKLDKAEEYLNQALMITKAIPIRGEYADISSYLATLYKKKGDFKQALLHSDEYQAINDSLFNVNKFKQLSLLQTQFGIAEKERANEALKADLAHQKTRNAYLVVGSVLLLLIVALGALLAIQNKRNNVRLEQTVSERTQELQVANQELKEFAYITSHDMREPIRCIHSFSNLASRRLADNQLTDVNDYLDIIEKSSIQLNRLVSDVYNFIKIDDLSLQKTTFDLKDLLGEVTTDLALQIQEKNAVLDFGPSIQVESNFSLLKIVFKNLIENGIKYNESDPVKMQIQSIETPSMYKFTVADNGIGVEKRYQEYIFRMFKRLNDRSKYPGSGLGLSITKKIVNQLGGDIQLGEIGIDQRGTSFVFTIAKS